MSRLLTYTAVFLLLPAAWAAHARAGVRVRAGVASKRAKDDGDAGGGDDLEPMAPINGGDAGPPPDSGDGAEGGAPPDGGDAQQGEQDPAGIMASLQAMHPAPGPGDGGGDSFEAQVAVKAAGDRHTVMKQFMHNFAQNMRFAVLEDSGGDMPEEERQRMMNAIHPGSGGDGGAPGGGGDGGPPSDADDVSPVAGGGGAGMVNQGSPPEDQTAPPMEEEAPRPRHHHRRMLNGGDAPDAAPAVSQLQHHHRHGHHHRMLNGGGGGEEAQGEPEMPQQAPLQPADDDVSPVPGGEETAAPVRGAGLEHLKVRDEMGRTMPLLFGGEPPAATKSAAQGHMVLLSIAGILSVLSALVSA